MVRDTIESPRDLFEYELQILYHMEHEIVDLHENLTHEAESEELPDLFSAHGEGSHVTRSNVSSRCSKQSVRTLNSEGVP